MAKAKPSKALEAKQKAMPSKPSKTISGGKFTRIRMVSGSQLKTRDNEPVYVKITNAIDVQAKLNKDKTPKLNEEGDPATINILKVVDLETGELATMVAGAALCDRLRTFDGGNEAYVGRCFEIVKKAAAPPARWKDYEIFEIDAPGEGAV